MFIKYSQSNQNAKPFPLCTKKTKPIHLKFVFIYFFTHKKQKKNGDSRSYWYCVRNFIQFGFEFVIQLQTQILKTCNIYWRHPLFLGYWITMNFIDRDLDYIYTRLMNFLFSLQHFVYFLLEFLVWVFQYGIFSLFCLYLIFIFNLLQID